MTNKFQDFHMPRYDEIPDIDLYMDQLLAYIEKILAPLFEHTNEKILTTSMVNNYVKQGVLPPTVKKRYSREHVIILIEICLAKQIYSILPKRAFAGDAEKLAFERMAEQGTKSTKRSI